jgi:flagellar hook assembly protein FlgD
MRKKWHASLMMVYAAMMAASAGAGKDETPSRLEYRRIRDNDEAVVALLAQRVVQGLQSNDPYLYLIFLAENLNKALPGAKVIDYKIELAQGKLNLRFVKNGERWNLIESNELAAMAKSAHKLRKASTNEKSFSLLNASANKEDDKTFISRALSPEYHINMLSRRVTAERLNRNLFSMPAGSALFAKLRQFDTAPYFQATYVQLVTDPAWNRIVYGDYQKWIKAYDGAESGLPLNRPQGIAVDPQGLVYVADAGNSRVLALKLSGPVNDLKLSYLGAIGVGELAQPTELAWDDRGTIFDAGDDLLWVIDRGANKLLAYHTAAAAQSAAVSFASENFADLSALAIGRFDGRSDGNIYLADAGARKVHRLHFDGAQIVSVSSFQGEAEMVPSALSTDHWGQVYLSDEAHRKIQKFSPALEPLAELRSDDPNFQPVRFQPLFGSVGTSSNQISWSGYDQAFLLEKWTDDSGGRRFELGIDFHLNDLRVTDDLSALLLAGKLTDSGQLKIEIVKNNMPIVAIVEAWHNSGEVELRWDRRMPDGEMIAPGYYKLRQVLRSTYEKPEVVNESAAFYLPLYYYEDCGIVGRDAHLVHGTRMTAYGSEPELTLAIDDNEVIYRFNDLDPAVAYEVKASYFSGGDQVEQALYAESNLLHQAMTIGRVPAKTEWLAIPAQAIVDRALDLRFVKTGGSGSASVAEIWLREANYNPNNPPTLATASEQIPQKFTLLQNYPNPFNPSTTIEFSIPADYRGYVSLRIYNMLGVVVRELVAGELAAGNYRQVWDGLDGSGHRLPTGLYVYQLRAGNFSAARKLLLVK